MPIVTQLNVNGNRVRVSAEGERSLLSVLRDDLELTGAKYGCGEGQCGACTVLIDGAPRRACITPVGSVTTASITTVEGLEQNDRLHPLQEAFLEVDALQCGYCASGMLMSGVALLQKNGSPTRSEIVRAMDGNICRCGCYPRILAAVARAAGKSKEGRR
jgi:aerobic-type carbon monoxide dehydrogenase small subunit (CoxS/CutS family)